MIWWIASSSEFGHCISKPAATDAPMTVLVVWLSRCEPSHGPSSRAIFGTSSFLMITPIRHPCVSATCVFCISTCCLQRLGTQQFLLPPVPQERTPNLTCQLRSHLGVLSTLRAILGLLCPVSVSVGPFNHCLQEFLATRVLPLTSSPPLLLMAYCALSDLLCPATCQSPGKNLPKT